MTKWSARLAIGFAVFLALAEIRRNWGDWGYAPFWIVDYIAVALLLYGGLRTLRRGAGAGLPALAGGWGFACAMFYASFFAHLEHFGEPERGPVEPVALTLTIGALFVLTILGFALAMLAAAGAAVSREKA
jgi:hypothetical protein